MDFELSDDQQALQEGIRALCRGRAGMERVRAAAGTGGIDRGLWQELADAGVFSLRLPEADGGIGLGLADAVLVFEELGRALVPGPLVATHLAAGLVAGAATGDIVVGVVEEAVEPCLVDHAGILDVLVVDGDGGLRALDARALDLEPVPSPLDPLTPLHYAGSLPAGDPLIPPGGPARWRQEGAVLTAALQLGIAEATTDLAVAYAKERHQFERPIGSFQAVKHLLADMLVRAEVARAAVYAAGVHLDDPETGDPARAASTAKLVAGEAAVANAKSCIQVHGGMGFTWEVDAHLYLKRAWVHDTVFGTPDDHAEAIAAVV